MSVTAREAEHADISSDYGDGSYGHDPTMTAENARKAGETEAVETLMVDDDLYLASR
ncbi:hypothetical protein ACLF3G_27250 [Falsiroseomonas sp. HC035]|uniref:hypothetical protein n=1 Tax=Falsiroseomonas sp. HC035 TaxID=3390999 RepID=UPI003D31E800